MNHSIIDPYQGDFPEVIEEFLEQGVARCIAFNSRGTLLAAGCTDGTCVIWDFETRGVAKELRDKDYGAAITSVCWSRRGCQLLTSATDKSLTLWDVAEGRKVARITLQQTALYARLHPGSRNRSLGLACPMASAPILVDFNSSNQYVLPVSAHSAGTEQAAHPRSKFSDGSAALKSAAASFNKRGDLIYVGNSKGDILIIDTETRKVKAVFQVPGNGLIRQLVFSNCGKYLLSNSGDRTIRVFENCLPQDKAARALEDLVNASGDSAVTENIKLVGSQCLKLSKEFQDAVNRLPWKAACFSGDSEWVVGAPASKGEHKICIWDRSGQLVKILEGPKEGLTDLSWHPIRPVVVSVAMPGVIYIWAKDYTENWSAFAPDFKELEENEEYIEREDEFDMMPDTEKVKIAHVDEDEEVDIMTTENFLDSDSDESGERLYHLPTIPLPDSPKQQEQSSASPSKPESSTPPQSDRSPALDEEKANRTPENSAAQAPDSPLEEQSLNGRAKRKRKLSEKGAELQAEKGRRTFQKHGSTAKRKTGVNFMNTNKVDVVQGGLLDSSSNLKSGSKADAGEPFGNGDEPFKNGDEAPSLSQKGGKNFQRFNIFHPCNYTRDSSSSPGSEANGFENGRYL